MKKHKIIYLQNDEAIEAKINALMEAPDIDDTEMLLNGVDIEGDYCDQQDMNDIKARTAAKLGIDLPSPDTDQINSDTKHNNISTRRKNIRWKRYAAVAVVFILCLFTGSFSDHIVQAISNMISLIPGVGISENNQEIKYQLKTQVTEENEQGSLEILYVSATEDKMTVRFHLEGNYTEEQMERNKRDSQNGTIRGSYRNYDYYILVDDQKIQGNQGSSGAGFSEYTYSITDICNFEMDQKYINTKEHYTLVCEDFNIRAEFQLVTLEQYNSLNEIGATETHNDISLTATASLDNNQLSVNVYPVNNSDYNLISFAQDCNLEYFGKKMKLITNQGDKDYTPPEFYGTGINSAVTFDVSDGAEDYILSIPFVAVETNEQQEITLPIPEEGEKADVNKKVTFENGSVIIKSVEKLPGDIGSEAGYLKINLEYESNMEDQQLVKVDFTREAGGGYYPYYDSQNRMESVSYMLEATDKNNLILYITNPRYVLMEEYNLPINLP